jgi:hypothetical protein
MLGAGPVVTALGFGAFVGFGATVRRVGGTVTIRVTGSGGAVLTVAGVGATVGRTIESGAVVVATVVSIVVVMVVVMVVVVVVVVVGAISGFSRLIPIAPTRCEDGTTLAASLVLVVVQPAITMTAVARSEETRSCFTA